MIGWKLEWAHHSAQPPQPILTGMGPLQPTPQSACFIVVEENKTSACLFFGFLFNIVQCSDKKGL
jgi:hypothetical protein